MAVWDLEDLWDKSILNEGSSNLSPTPKPMPGSKQIDHLSLSFLFIHVSLQPRVKEQLTLSRQID